MRNTIMRSVVIAALGIAGIFAGTGSAHAALTHARLTAVATTAATQPTSTIRGAGNTRKFVPSTVTASPATGTCGSTNYSFLIKNQTKATQTAIYMGAPLGLPIKPKQGLFVCASGAGSGTITLKGDAKAKLNFTIT